MNFYEKVKGQVAELTPEYNYPNDGTSFGHFIIRECFTKIVDFGFDGQDIDDFIKGHIVDGANDNGNDAIFMNKEQRRILVFQFKYSQNSNLLNTDEIRKNKKFVDWILRISPNNLTPNSKLKKVLDNEISEILTESALRDNQYSIAFYYIDRQFPQRNKVDIQALFTNYNDKGIKFEINYYDYDMLNNLYDDIEIPKNEVELNVVPSEYFIKNFNYHDSEETNIETIVCSIRANSLKKLVHQYNELLFSLNVRYFKGENEINSKIKQEYSKGSKSNFWILNNGIQAICENFELSGENLQIKNLQIVNGGQTSMTLRTIVNDLPDEVHILMRLTKIATPNKVSKISKEIATTSNNQNAITQRDLHSGDRLQKTISDKLDEANIFYDKKDGEWATISNKAKYKNPFGRNPMYLRINNTLLGKSYLSYFLQLPISSKGRDKLVYSEEYYSEIFNKEVNEDEQFYKLIFAYRITEKINYIKQEKEKDFEILQNSFINDVIISLSALFFLRSNLGRFKEPSDIKELINQIDFKRNLDKNNKYYLILGSDFDEFVLKIIQGLQFTLDVLQTAKESNGEKWQANDTNKWLKLDTTYKQIINKVIAYLIRYP